MSSRFVKEFNRLIKSIDKKFAGQASIRDYDVDNMNCFIVELAPNNGPYKHGKFLFQIHASDHYPDSAPDVVCLTDIYHPNIDADLTLEHNICLNLFDEWNRTFGIEDCLQGLLFLLYHPNISDPVSSYFESGLDQATFLSNVGKSLRGEEVDGFAFQKNHGWAEHEAAQALGLEPAPASSVSAISASNGENSAAAAAAASIVAMESLQPNTNTEAQPAYSTAAASCGQILTNSLSDCKMATRLNGGASDAATSKQNGDAAEALIKDNHELATTSKQNGDTAEALIKDNHESAATSKQNGDTGEALIKVNHESAATSKQNGDAAEALIKDNEATSDNGSTAELSHYKDNHAAAKTSKEAVDGELTLDEDFSAAKPGNSDALSEPIEAEINKAESSHDAASGADKDVDFPRLLLDGTSMPATVSQSDREESTAVVVVDSGRPDSPDSLSLASDSSLQDLLMQLQFAEALSGADGNAAADLPRDFVCRRFRAASNTPDVDDDDDDEEDEEDISDILSSEDDEENEFTDEEDEDVGAGELVASVQAGVVPLPRPTSARLFSVVARRRRRPDPAAVAATAAAAAAATSRRSLTVVARSAAPVVIRLRGGGMRSVQLLQVEASSRYPGMLSISLNGWRLQPSLARLLLRQAAGAFADTGFVWLDGGAGPMTIGGGADAACLLLCALIRQCLLPSVL